MITVFQMSTILGIKISNAYITLNIPLVLKAILVRDDKNL